MAATALASRIRDRRMAAAIGAVVLVLGLVPQTTMWDSAVLTESFALSLTALLLASWVWWADRPQATWPAAAFVVTLLPWLFARDAHPYLAVVPVAAAVALAVRHREVRWVAPVVLVLFGWALFTARADTWVEEYNVKANLGYRVALNEDWLGWWLDAGMPDVAGLHLDGADPRLDALVVDEQLDDWVREKGVATYLRFAASHPDYLLGQSLRNLAFAGDSVEGETIIGTGLGRYGGPMQEVVPPPVASLVRPDGLGTLASLAAAAVALLVVVRQRSGEDRRWGLPLVLLVCVGPAAVFVWHGSPLELARHGVVLALVTYVALWFLVVVLVDGLLQPTREEPPGRSQGAGSHGVG